MDLFTMFLYITIVEYVGLGIFAFWHLIWRDKDKTFFLYFDSDKSCSLEAKKIQDGFVKFKKKYFYVDKAKPMIMQRFMGFQNPLLFIRWNDFIPIDVIRKNINPYFMINDNEILTDPDKIESLNEKQKKAVEKHIEDMKKNPDKLLDYETKKFKKFAKDSKDLGFQSYQLRKKLTPETLKDVMDCKIASNLLKPIGVFDMFLWLAIGSAVGFLLCVSLFAFNVIPNV